MYVYIVVMDELTGPDPEARPGRPTIPKIRVHEPLVGDRPSCAASAAWERPIGQTKGPGTHFVYVRFPKLGIRFTMDLGPSSHDARVM